MATATLPRTASFILPQLRLALGYADMLAADIPPDRFAHCPVPNVNHPAFCFGHLSIYPERLLEMLGRPELARPDARFVELFRAGSKCVEEAGRHPPKDEIMARFKDRWEVIATVLPQIPEERFLDANPAEGRMKELMPTLGAMAIFMCGTHMMMHLGQVSIWRRLIGLGPVM